jgi:hypothetical protein
MRAYPYRNRDPRHGQKLDRAGTILDTMSEASGTPTT